MSLLMAPDSDCEFSFSCGRRTAAYELTILLSSYCLFTLIMLTWLELMSSDCFLIDSWVILVFSSNADFILLTSSFKVVIS